MYEFEKKANNQKAINRIKNFNPKELSQEDEKGLTYTFPSSNRGYISSALRGYKLKDIPLPKLTNIYRKTAMIDDYIRSNVAITIMYKLHKEQGYNLDSLEEVKQELLCDMTCQGEKPLVQNNNVDSVLYILHISIGTDHFYKYGITRNINDRMRTLKSTIKSCIGYSSRCVNIEVLGLEYNLKEPTECEDEIKQMTKAKKIKSSGYYFEGGRTETIDKEHFDRFRKFAKEIINKHTTTLPHP